MSLIETIKFFFTTFHSGTVNIILHLVSLAPLIVGLLSEKVYLVVLFYVIESSGHVYNYVFKFDQELRRKSIEVIPLQIIIPGLFIFVLLILFKFF